MSSIQQIIDATPKEPVKGEHIFPATIVEPLAVKWKELTMAAKLAEKDGKLAEASAKHAEANIVLEDIVCKAAPMFIRMAQYEGYHHTVELESLVLAAQARVATWLLYWDPLKGKLFSWISKSLEGNSEVLLADGTTKPIKEIVEKKLQVSVVSYDEKAKRFVDKPVVGWIKSPGVPPPDRRKHNAPFAEDDKWRTLSVQKINGKKRRGVKLLLTGDHPVLTERGWIEVDSLDSSDILYRKFDGAGIPVKCTFTVKPAYLFQANNTGVDFNWRYDITVADTYNFVANGVIVHNCAKHVFLSEVVKTSVYRRRYYPTSDNLEKFVGSVDTAQVTHEAAESVREMIGDLACRWGNQQAMCCIRYHVACIVENPKGKKRTAIMAGAYASGLSLDLSKFFYNWALIALRDAMYDKMNIPYTEQDLFRLKYSFTYLPDLVDIITWQKMLEVIAKMGGLRLKLPTLAQLERDKADYKLFRQMERGNHDPESVEKVAKDNHISPLSAQEIYERMVAELHDDRSGEFSLYD